MKVKGTKCGKFINEKSVLGHFRSLKGCPSVFLVGRCLLWVRSWDKGRYCRYDRVAVDCANISRVPNAKSTQGPKN